MAIYNREDSRTVLPQLEKKIEQTSEAIEQTSEALDTLGGAFVEAMANSEVTSCPHAAWTVLGSFPVPDGVSFVDVQVRFTSNTTGYRRIMVSYNSNADDSGSVGFIATDTQAPVSSISTTCQAHFPYHYGKKRLYIKAYQTSGSALTTTTRVFVTRIK